jgi:hypothetical protein
VLPDELGVTLGGTCLTLYGQNKTIPVNESCVLDCINSTLVASIGVEGTVFSCSAVSEPSLTPNKTLVCTKPGVSRCVNLHVLPSLETEDKTGKPPVTNTPFFIFSPPSTWPFARSSLGRLHADSVAAKYPADPHRRQRLQHDRKERHVVQPGLRARVYGDGQHGHQLRRCVSSAWPDVQLTRTCRACHFGSNLVESCRL